METRSEYRIWLDEMEAVKNRTPSLVPAAIELIFIAAFLGLIVWGAISARAWFG